MHGLRGVALSAALLVGPLLAVVSAAAAAEGGPAMRVDPPQVQVAGGEQFTITVIATTAVPTTGAQVSIHFDPKVIRVLDLALGDDFTSRSAIFAFGNADRGTSGNKDATIRYANENGTVENAAGFLLPGSGSIPAGDIPFLSVTFAALGGAGGTSNLSIGDTSLIDEQGVEIAGIEDRHSVVTVTPGGSPEPSGALGSSGPAPSATDAGGALVSPATPVKVALAPTTLDLKAGNTARIFLVADAGGNISSVAADLTFDPAKLQITALEAGPAWAGAVVIAVANDRSGGVDAAIAEANASGTLQQAGVFYPPGTQELPYGQAVFVSVLVQAKVDGMSALSIGKVAVLGVTGETVAAEVDTSSLTKAPDKGTQLDPTLVVPIGLLGLLVGGGIIAARSGLIPVRIRRRWPFYVSLGFGLIPVVLFSGMVVMLVINSLPVVSFPGLPAVLGLQATGEFGRDLSTYSLTPALWGTVLVTIVASAIALPIGLAVAVVAVDYPLGPVSRIVRPIVGVLSGIPPIVYAVSVPVFITALMIPKFAANQTFSTFQQGGPAAIGADPSTWPPADVPYSAGGFPWDLTGVANSTLLGGILVGLFLIPFVTPLFVDALRDVPRSAREASLALGANRTYTLRRVVLPRALPGIIGASSLAMLKAFGDFLIVGFAIGWAAGKFPNPLVDVLERVTTLAAQGAGILGSFETLDASCQTAQCAVGYTGALGLLILATIVVVAMTAVQARGRRRVAA